MNLYMISLGGKVEPANIEVHDVQFIAANDIDNSIETLKKIWYGEPQSLHMDSHKHISSTNGYSVKLSKSKSDQNLKLYFIYLGKYDESNTQELHYVDLVVARNEKDAKTKALRPDRQPSGTHVDAVVDVEAKLHAADGETYYLILDALEAGHEASLNLVSDVKPDWKGFKKLY